VELLLLDELELLLELEDWLLVLLLIVEELLEDELLELLEDVLLLIVEELEELLDELSELLDDVSGNPVDSLELEDELLELED